MKYYIDFDNTLFNTSLFFDDLINILKRNNVDITKLNYNDKDLLGKIFNKTIDVSCICNNNIKVTAELEELTKNIPNYLYEDSLHFLKYLQVKNYQTVLLTYGNKNYQEYKVLNSNIKDYFQDIIITDIPKYKLDLDFNNMVFIDDNVDDLLMFKKKGSKVIRIRRPNNKRSIIDLPNILEFSNFDDLLKSKELDNL